MGGGWSVSGGGRQAEGEIYPARTNTDISGHDQKREEWWRLVETEVVKK
jgi:hypothetical protein